MRHRHIPVIIAFFVLIIWGCTGGDETKIDSVSDFNIALERAHGYAYPSDTMNLDTARQMGLVLLEHDSVKSNPVHRMEVLRLLTDVARLGQDYEEQVKWASQLVTLCRSRHDETEALRSEAEIGIVLTQLGQRMEGLALLDSVIAQLETQRHFCELDACVIAMKRKLTALSLLPEIAAYDGTVVQEQRCADIIALAQRLIGKLDDYEQHPDDYADGSPRQPASDEVLGYCDFYRSQAYAFLAQAYATSGKFGDARHYESLFSQSDYGQTLNGRSAIAETWRMLGDFDKMLATYDEIDSLMGDDTLNINYARQLRGRAIAAEARGDHAASQVYWLRHSLLSEAVNDQLQYSQAHDYATRYHTRKLQQEMEMHREEKRTVIAVNVAMFIFLLAAICITAMLYHRNRLIRQKNRSLVRQISDAMDYKDKYFALSRTEEKTVGSTNNLDTMDASALFQSLSRVIIDERLFLDANFDRQSVIDRFHLSKERVGTAFAQGSEYASLAAFVTACRLEYATHLLLEQPSLPIAQVATASGFSSANHFSRNFKTVYGLSATEFRKQSEQS